MTQKGGHLKELRQPRITNLRFGSKGVTDYESLEAISIVQGLLVPAQAQKDRENADGNQIYKCKTYTDLTCR